MAPIKPKTKRVDPDERARRALSEFRDLQPALTAYARVLTGKPDVRVEAAVRQEVGGAATDGTRIYLRPPMILGDISLRNHRRGPRCDQRDDQFQLQCDVCSVREHILSLTYHEVSHIAFDSFVKVRKTDYKTISRVIANAAPSWYAERVEERIKRAGLHRYDAIGYNQLAQVISPYMGAMVSALEDVRIDQRMIDARPGTAIMKVSKIYKTANEGVEQVDHITGRERSIPWREYDPNQQAVLGCLLIAGGFNPSTWLIEPVVNVLNDVKVRALLADVNGLPNVGSIFTRAFEVFLRLRELGFLILADEEPPPTEPEAPELPPEEEPNDDDEADKSDAGPESGGADAGDGADDSDPMGDESEDGSGGDDHGSDPDGEPRSGDADLDNDGEDADGSPDGGDADADKSGTGGNAGDSDVDGEADADADADASGEGSHAPGSDAEHDGSDADAAAADADDAASDGGGSGSGEDGAAGEGYDAGSGAGGDPDAHGDEDDRAGDGGSDSLPDSGGSSSVGGSADADANTEAGGDSGRSREAGDAEGAEDDDASADGAGREGNAEGGPSADAEHLDGDAPADGDHDSEHNGERGDATPAEGRVPEGDDADAGDFTDGEVDRGGEGDAEDGSRDGDAGADQEGGASGGSDEEEGELGEADPLAYKPDAASAIDNTDAEPVYSPPPTMTSGEKFTIEDLGLHPPVDSADDSEGGSMDDALEKAIIQSVYFEQPSSHIGGLRVWKFADRYKDIVGREHHAWRKELAMKAWGRHTYSSLNPTVDQVGEDVLGPALMRMRLVFSENMRGKHDRNRRSGRIDSRSLGKRAPFRDDRMFSKKTLPSKRDYFVVIEADVSGSTMGENIKMIKEAVFAQAELLDRVGIKFAVYAHSGSPLSSGGRGSRSLWVDQYEIKGPDQAWNDEAKQALHDIGPSAANLDGHTIEFARKLLDTRTETTKIMLYYSDGAMPLENHNEELEILKREIALCKSKGYVLLGVGVQTDSPRRHGLDTVQIDNSGDVGRVVEHLERVLVM